MKKWNKLYNRGAVGAARVLDNTRTQKALFIREFMYATVPADGDIIIMEAICAGDETTITIGTNRNTSRGIFDLYINGVLDSSGYDDYGTGAAAISRTITLASPPRNGINTIELRVNGKNASSTNYFICPYGVSLS